MKHETRESVKKSMLDIDERLEKRVGAHQLHGHESMTDDEFKELVHTLTRDILSEFEDAKKRNYDEGFQAALKASGDSKPLVFTQEAPQHDSGHEIDRAEDRLAGRLDSLFADHAKLHNGLEESDRSLHAEIREIRDEVDSVKRSAAPDKNVEELVLKANERFDEISGQLEGHSKIAEKVDALSERMDKLSSELDPERTLNLIIDNTTKVNALSRRLTNFSKRVRRSTRRAEEVYKLSARKGLAKRLAQHRKRVEEVYRLSERKHKPAKKPAKA